MGSFSRQALIVSAVSATILLSGCEVSPKQSAQTGYRGTGIVQVVNPSLEKREKAIPANAYETPADTGQRAREIYQNVPVLGGISADQFNHFMANMNNWVVPAEGLPASEQGCNYCHNPENMASDEKYTKIVARKMIQMTQTINANYTQHVQQTGVTCWTCHRGNAVPTYRWSAAAPEPGTIRGNKRGQNTPGIANNGFTSMNYDPFSGYLTGPRADGIRVGGSVYAPKPGVSTQSTEKTYALMMHMSKGLGVNCTYCHNTNNFQSWTNSSPQRAVAWHGLRMTAATNHDYMTPLQGVFPAASKVVAYDKARRGPMGDVYKVNCQTCHQGVNKPMGGVSMKDQAPYLWPAPAAGPVAAGPVAAGPSPAIVAAR